MELGKGLNKPETVNRALRNHRFPIVCGKGEFQCLGPHCELALPEFKGLFDALRDSQQRIQIMADALPALISYVDSDERYRFNNAVYEQWFGGERASFIGRKVRGVLGPRAYARLKPEISAALRGERRSFELRLHYKEAGLRDVHVEYVPHRNTAGNIVGFFALVQDVSERKRLEREILDAGELELRRIAADLHDSLGQVLSGTRHLANVMRKTLEAKGAPEASCAVRIDKLLAECLQETRRLVRGLRPVAADPNALMLALEGLADRTRRLFSVDCQFLCDKPVKVENNTIATHLYRIVQEAITNAVRHGNAKRIRIALSSRHGELRLVIRDGGDGLRNHRATTGLGMDIMKYRAATIGAALEIRRRRPRGVQVVCVVENHCTAQKSGGPYERKSPKRRAQCKKRRIHR